MGRKLPSEPRAVYKGGYADLLGGLTRLLEEARRASVRSVNAVMTATYWEIGRRIVEFEQKGKKRADYGVALLKRLSSDLTDGFGRGFSERNLEQMRLFYLELSAGFHGTALSAHFPLFWSHYVRLLSVENPEARAFYETEALRGGWSVRQLDRQISTVARQKRLRVGDEWYRIDLLFFHRRLRCLIIIDLKIGKFTHADAGQMNLYLNYAREHWTHPDENSPIGLILCTKGNEAVAHYALGGLSNKVFASRYKLQLPDPEVFKHEIEAERRRLEARARQEG